MPHFDDFTPIVVLTKTSAYGDLGPYVLKDTKGRLMENIWQFAKVYQRVSTSGNDRYNPGGWRWPTEAHVIDGDIQPAYWKWRRAGMNFPKAVRSPVSYKERSSCLYCYWPSSQIGKKMTLKGLKEIAPDPDLGMAPSYNSEDWVRLEYIPARYKVYAPLYLLLARQEPQFKELSEMLEQGYNLQILDVDGPHRVIDDTMMPVPPYETMGDGIYGDDQVGSIPITEYTISKLLEDVTHPFGHGYVLAVGLLGKDEWILDHQYLG